MAEATVEYEKAPPLATVWLNRPEARTAFDLAILRGLRRALAAAERDPGAGQRRRPPGRRPPPAARGGSAGLPAMAERGWGRLVCIASDAGRAGSLGEAVYSAAKAGVIAFCKTLGQELGRRGVTCNAVSPGPTDTRLLRDYQSEQPERAERLRRRIPAGRFGEPEDVAALVGFLCSDRAGYLNGQVISVNGGLHSL
jgi:NAD(P)-dependent dehydrogenase (short-subunit alcohol dehydrogenase family)